MSKIKVDVTDLVPRMIKNEHGNKVLLKVTSVNLTEGQLDFIKDNEINLSALVRDIISKLMVQHLLIKKGG